MRIVDGGLVSVPGVHRRGFIGLPPGVAYACLAETLLRRRLRAELDTTADATAGTTA